MAEKITKPMLLDETGKALVEAVQQIAEKIGRFDDRNSYQR